MVETNPADHLHELLAELLGALGHTPPGLQDETGAYPKTFKPRRFLHPAKLAAQYLPDSFEVHQKTSDGKES